MKALVLRNDPSAASDAARELLNRGFQVLCADNCASALSLIRAIDLDLLVLDERIAGQLTHAIVLSAERRNPDLRAIVMNDRKGRVADELFALLPSLHAQLGSAIHARVIGQLAGQVFAPSSTGNDAAPVPPHAVFDAVAPDDFAPNDDVFEEVAFADNVFAAPALRELGFDVPVESGVAAELAALYAAGAGQGADRPAFARAG